MDRQTAGKVISQAYKLWGDAQRDGETSNIYIAAAPRQHSHAPSWTPQVP
jgi:hypothetical protein